MVTALLQKRCDLLIQRFRARPDASARTLLVTVFGDSVEPHGGEVWIGSLLRLVEPLGINERLARTSLNRLVREDLLATRRHGRRSFYSVTPTARNDFGRAERLIYHPRTGTWDGRWTVVVETTALAGPARASVRAHLVGMGLGPLGGGVHAAPADRTDALRQLLADVGLGDRLAVFRGELPPGIGLGNREVAGILCPELKDLESAWRSFVRRFGPIAEAASGEGAEAVSPGTAFGARTLLVHEYRRIALREPELPSSLWPPGWVGETAYEVAARCYHAVSAAAEAHLLAVCDADRSPLLPYDPEYADRFAGVRSLAPTDLMPRRYSGSSCEP